MTGNAGTQRLAGLRAVAGAHDSLILDAWETFHAGGDVLPAAGAAAAGWTARWWRPACMPTH